MGVASVTVLPTLSKGIPYHDYKNLAANSLFYSIEKRIFI
jgi:hypothetical protein